MEDLLNKTPGELAELRLVLADTFSRAGELLVSLKRQRATHYKANRANFKSDSGWEREWELTSEGLNMMELEQKMKSIKMKQSAIRTLLEVKTEEAHNTY